MNSSRPARPFACVFAASALVVATVNGCAKTSPATADTQSSNDRVEVTLVDRARFDAVVAGLRDNVVLVDCWATWCLPCVEQLPHTVELARSHADAGLAVVTLSFDDPDSSEQVRELLARVGADRLTNLQCTAGASPQAMDEFEIASGALPHYKLYDRDGNLHRTFDLDPSAERQFTTADVEAAVAELLAE